jgi:hypothetical protein
MHVVRTSGLPMNPSPRPSPHPMGRGRRPANAGFMCSMREIVGEILTLTLFPLDGREKTRSVLRLLFR